MGLVRRLADRDRVLESSSEPLTLFIWFLPAESEIRIELGKELSKIKGPRFPLADRARREARALHARRRANGIKERKIERDRKRGRNREAGEATRITQALPLQACRSLLQRRRRSVKSRGKPGNIGARQFVISQTPSRSYCRIVPFAPD